ncbi:MAG TPA: pyridoxamine 5'-phosphate oxidase family protein [Ilumatobacteraceae bacterium]|nr:pyridoxamine 5'-phosphate oxidase family protein [Ilumatobacteraceae bacterium]
MAELAAWECYDLLSSEGLGRMCVIDRGYPIAYPVNYRLVQTVGTPRIIFRTSPNAAMTRCEGAASFEVDHVSPARGQAWSVIARGHLRRLFGVQHLPDTMPLVSIQRHQWMELDITSVTGRRFVVAGQDEFSTEWTLAT